MCEFGPCCCRGEWIFGYPTESLVGQAAHVLRHPGDQLSVEELIQTKDYSESFLALHWALDGVRVSFAPQLLYVYKSR